MKRKTIMAATMLALVLSACNGGKSEAEIRKEIMAEIQHKEDSVRLAEAEAKAAAAEEAAQAAQRQAEEAAQAAQRQAEQAAKKAAAAAEAAAKKAAASALANVGAQSSSRSADYSNNPYAWLSQRYVTDNDLYGCSAAELRIMRNAIFARHGYRFKSADLMRYFSQYSWYVPRYSDVSSQLSAIENANVQAIKSWE